uniref:Methyltransferase FkbM domain-containing protein n=1 Tax=Palpitomonas bilix TaxID=652834 RepID=A0A7S3D0T3_9EUKA|mmetsp:Transcript_17409/g.43372  ORF Transcript_17409/g.43372 Transcript_17409/m.43372 type:complete len:465 (+) Transcript_17409:75-1469(+)
MRVEKTISKLGLVVALLALALPALSSAALPDAFGDPGKEELCENFADCLSSCVKKLSQDRQFTDILDCSDKCAETNCRLVDVDAEGNIIYDPWMNKGKGAATPPPPVFADKAEQEYKQPASTPSPASQPSLSPAFATSTAAEVEAKQDGDASFNFATATSQQAVPRFGSKKRKVTPPSPAAPPTPASAPTLGANLLEGLHPALSIKKGRDGIFAASKVDGVAGKAVEELGEFGGAQIQLLSQMIREEDVIVDVGAHIGMHSVYFARKVGRQGKVIAFEANRRAFQLLNTNLALNSIYNVDALRLAVDETGGQRFVTVDPQCSSCSTISASPAGNSEPVQAVSIDSLRLDKARLLRIACNGNEAAVVRGAKTTITSLKPALFIQAYFDPSDNTLTEQTEDLIRLVHSLEYDMYWHFSPIFTEQNYFKKTASETTLASHPSQLFMLCVPKGNTIQGLERVEIPSEF